MRTALATGGTAASAAPDRCNARLAMVTTAFRTALSADGLSIIAEIKRRSPSRGPILPPGTGTTALAGAYESGGAACISVLTDGPLFGGSGDDLRRARSAVSIPVLRKDFLANEQDVRESCAMGAHAVLLIMADLGAHRLAHLHEMAVDLGMGVLAEVRTERELEAAVNHGACVIAVNQRDDPRAATPTVDFGRATRMARLFDQVRPEVLKVAASGIGITGGTPIAEVAEAGYDAALIGEALAAAPDPAEELRRLRRQAAG